MNFIDIYLDFDLMNAYICCHILTTMNNRKQRLPIIARILTTKKIRNQQELLNELAIEGCEITQATLSRDLRNMNVSKVIDVDGGYSYHIGQNSSYLLEVKRLPINVPFIPDIAWIKRSGFIVVIKLPASQAVLLSRMFDESDNQNIVATAVLGDLLLMILKEGLSFKQRYELLAMVISNDCVNKFKAAL